MLPVQDEKEHLAIIFGALEQLRDSADVYVRVHSECFTGEVGSASCARRRLGFAAVANACRCRGAKGCGGRFLLKWHWMQVLGSLRCDCGEQLATALNTIATKGKGVVVFLKQEGRGIGLKQKLKCVGEVKHGWVRT